MVEYISREAVCNALNSEGYTKNMRVHKKVLNIPAADVVEVRHGRWYLDNGCAFCSECKNSFDPKIKSQALFCPRCGAKMDGGQEPPEEVLSGTKK